MAANIPYPFQENKKCTFINFFSSQSPNVVNFVKQEFSDMYVLHMVLNLRVKYSTHSRTNKRRALGGNFLLTTPNQINITYTSCKFLMRVKYNFLNEFQWFFISVDLPFYFRLISMTCGKKSWTFVTVLITN